MNRRLLGPTWYHWLITVAMGNEPTAPWIGDYWSQIETKFDSHVQGRGSVWAQYRLWQQHNSIPLRLVLYLAQILIKIVRCCSFTSKRQSSIVWKRLAWQACRPIQRGLTDLYERRIWWKFQPRSADKILWNRCRANCAINISNQQF